MALPLTVSVPAYVATAGLGEGDPRPMLLWYAAAGVSVLVSLIVGILAIADFFARRRDAAAARDRGGYVTHPQLNGELAAIYQKLDGTIEKLRTEMAAQHKEITRALTKNAEEIAKLDGRIDGQLEGQPPRRRS